MELPLHTPALDHFLGAYFHQDWGLDGTEGETVEMFLADEPDLAAALAGEIDALLAEVPDEDDLRRLLFAKGSYYTPSTDESGYRKWLQEVSRRARAHTRGE
jgi:hypothetical protein